MTILVIDEARNCPVLLKLLIGKARCDFGRKALHFCYNESHSVTSNPAKKRDCRLLWGADCSGRDSM
jgi:hypothetical protein